MKRSEFLALPFLALVAPLAKALGIRPPRTHEFVVTGTSTITVSTGNVKLRPIWAHVEGQPSRAFPPTQEGLKASLAWLNEWGGGSATLPEGLSMTHIEELRGLPPRGA